MPPASPTAQLTRAEITDSLAGICLLSANAAERDSAIEPLARRALTAFCRSNAHQIRAAERTAWRWAVSARFLGMGERERAASTIAMLLRAARRLQVAA